MLTLCCDRCENVTFLRRLKLKCDLVKIRRCYCATPHLESSLSTGTKSTCSLATRLHLNEYDTDCLLFVCVCVCVDIYIYYSSIDHNVRVFMFLSLWNRCRHLSHQWVCPNDLLDFVRSRKHGVFAQCSSAVLVRPGLAEDMTDLKEKHPLSIKLLDTLNSIMWLTYLCCIK